MPGDTHRAGERSEEVTLLTVEINAERLDIFQRAKACLAVLGLETVMIVGYVSEKINAPAFVWRKRQICLIIKKFRYVLTICLQ